MVTSDLTGDGQLPVEEPQGWMVTTLVKLLGLEPQMSRAAFCRK